MCYFPIGILGQVWCLIVSIPDLCPLFYFVLAKSIKLISFERRELEINYFLLANISICRWNAVSVGSVEYRDKIFLAMGPLLNTMKVKRGVIFDIHAWQLIL